jgi:hypothetical protein
MKNIHIIPTDNYSDLVHSTNKYGGYFLSRHYSPMKGMGDSYQNIYITSDEEIKEGDWGYIQFEGGNIKLVGKYFADDWKKIILTTDQDLIKDGVQAIDDEFLEWFVKNPSCEEIEVKKGIDSGVNGFLKFSTDDVYDIFSYKIIIPKEEPKQYTSKELEGFEDFKSLIKQKQEELKFKNRQIGAAGFVANKIMENMISKPKQETIEEAAEYYAHNYFDMHETNNYKALKQGFDAGSKWQAERMYSNMEEYSAFVLKSYKERLPLLLAKDWFEQFKKK